MRQSSKQVVGAGHWDAHVVHDRNHYSAENHAGDESFQESGSQVSQKRGD